MHLLILNFHRYSLRFCLTVLGTTLLLLNATAQVHTFGNNLDFVNHLFKNKLFKETIIALENIDTTNFNKQQFDSLYYYKGYSNYSTAQFSEAQKDFLAVSLQSNKYKFSVFHAALIASQLNNYLASALILDSIQIAPSDTLYCSLLHIEKAGVALLGRNLQRYAILDTTLPIEENNFTAEKKRLNNSYLKLLHHKDKSPLIAGLMSGLLPGAGKYYVGKKGQGLSAFFTQAVLGLLTYEAYQQGGIKSLACISYASLFSLFYIGNVWGSVTTAKTTNKEFNQSINNEIMFTLKLPFGYVFR